MINDRPGLVRLPPHARGMRIGLFGGSFNPPHEGHVLVSRTALHRLRLDRVWWLVSPANPLKATRGLPPTRERVLAAQRIARDPRIVVTSLEEEMGTRYTRDAVAQLIRRAPGVRFVWLMGADNLLQFNRWRRWEEIARMVPIAVLDRPGATLKAASAKMARRFAYARLRESEAKRLAITRPPAFVLLHGPRTTQSSTALRRAASG